MKLAFRNVERADMPAIETLHAEQQTAQGSDYELPDLFGRQIAVAVVGCDPGGTIRQCFYCEAVAELRFIGHDPRATVQSLREADSLSYVLKRMGFRYLECYIPRRLGRAKKTIVRLLRRARFENKVKEFSYYSRDLRDK